MPGWRRSRSAKAERGFREVEVGVHRKIGEADVHSVEIGDEIADDQKGDEPPSDLADRPSLDVVRDDCSLARKASLSAGAGAV